MSENTVNKRVDYRKVYQEMKAVSYCPAYNTGAFRYIYI